MQTTKLTMRTTTLTITIEARANASEARIREALMADIDMLWQHRHARATEDGHPVTVVSVEPHETVERTVRSSLAVDRRCPGCGEIVGNPAAHVDCGKG